MVRALPRAGMFSLYFAALPSLWASDGRLGETHRTYLYTFVVWSQYPVDPGLT